MEDSEDIQRVGPTELDERYRHLRLERPSLTDAMAESLRRYGQLSPLIVTPREDVVAVVDGFKRLDAVRALGVEQVLVRHVILSEQAAVAAVYHYNHRTSQGLDDLEQAMIVRELYREQGLSQVEIGELLGRHKSWVCRRLAMLERLSEEVQNDVRVGLTSTTMARELTRLPRDNQPEVAACIAEHGLTTRQARRLVDLFEVASGREEQRDLLSQPRDALDADERIDSGIAPDPRLSRLANRLRRQLLIVEYDQAALRSVVTRCKPTTWSDTERDVVAPLVEQTADGCAELFATLGEFFEVFRP